MGNAGLKNGSVPEAVGSVPKYGPHREYRVVTGVVQEVPNFLLPAEEGPHPVDGAGVI